MKECLDYFRSAILHPDSVPSWTDWWHANEEAVRRSFDRADYLALKFRRLDAARAILARLGELPQSPRTTPPLSGDVVAEINQILYQENLSARLIGVAALSSSHALQRLANCYNWDDGFGIPTAIAEHPECDLGVALELFWLAEAIGWYTGEHEQDEYSREWIAFCQMLTDGILKGRYPKGATGFTFPLNVVRLHELRKQGVPDILVNDVHGCTNRLSDI